MGLTDRPTPPEFPAIGEGFTVTAAVPSVGVPAAFLIAIELPGGARRELIIREYLAEQIATVEPDELPVILCLRAPDPPDLPWRFEYLGKPDPAHQLAEAIGKAPDFPPVAPTPDQEYEAEALEDEPYVFDPDPHMDLATALPPTELPSPAPPAPPPPADAMTAPPNPVPAPQRPLGSYGDQSVPFAH
jgi:hypothetical protein